MIVDLNLRGKEVVVFGGGKEAVRKVEALLTQDCRIIAIAAAASGEIKRWAAEKKIVLKQQRVENGDCLQEFDRLVLVIAATDDVSLNRILVRAAKNLRCYAYAVDDPEHSDFSHPAVINLYDTVQIAVSTGGKSPLMAGKIRELAEAVFKELITKEDLLQIQLQGKLRQKVRDKIDKPDARKRFLTDISRDREIVRLLKQDKLDEAERAALKKLENFQ